MDTDEVIIEKEIINSNSNNECVEHVLVAEKSDIECVSSPNTGNNRNNDNGVNQGANDNCEVIPIDDIQTRANCNDKHNENEHQQKFSDPLGTNQSDILVINNKKNQSEQDFLCEPLKEKNDDICVIHEKIATPTNKNDQVSSLVSIAIEYENSDSEVEDLDQANHESNQTIPLKEVGMQTYRQNVEDSLSEESDSEDDSTSSSDTSEIVNSSDSESNDSSKKKGKGSTSRRQRNNEIKNELDDLPPIEDLKISVPEVLCDPLGEVAWMVDQLVVVKPKLDKPTLNLDTVLFVQRGQRALGKIFDVFGQVNEPHYCVRFNSSEHIKECDIKVGMTVYYCPNTEYTSLVFLHELMKIKGIDANADEPPEFSDDEEERAYYEQLKTKQANNINDADIPFKRKRSLRPASGWQSNHPWNRSAQKNRRGYHSRADRQLYNANQSQNLWAQSYQQSISEQYGYGAYSLQSMQCMNQNVNSVNQNFCPSQNYYNKDGTTYLNPRIPFSPGPRVCSGYAQFQNLNTPTDIRFQNTNAPWQPQMTQIPTTTKMSWMSLPPPPPPPPPPPAPSNSSSDTI